jgi:flagellin-specific chaperone FliS
MEFQRSQQIIPFIIGNIDKKVWQNIAVKAIEKMAPHKLTKEANKMFNDFTVLNSQINKESGTTITEELDNANKIT